MSTTPPISAAMPLHAAPAMPRDYSRLIQLLIFVVTAVLMLAPAIPIAVQVFIDRPLYSDDWVLTLDNFSTLFGSAQLPSILATTAIFALVTVVIAQVGGIAAALVLGRTDLPGRRLLGGILMWPLYLSHLIFAIGWAIIYGPSGFLTQWLARLLGGSPWNLYSLAGMSIVAGVSQIPLAYLYCLYGAVRSVDPTLESAACTVGAGPLGVLARVTLPLMVPSIITSAALNLIIAVETLSIPLFLGGPARIETLSTFLYHQGVAASNPDHGLIAASSVLLVLLVGSALMVQRLLLRQGHRYETVKGKGSRPAPLRLGALRWPLAILMAIFVTLFIVVPVFGVVLRAFTTFLSPLVAPWTTLTMRNFNALFASETFVRAIRNTFFVSFFSAAAGTVLAAFVALLIQRSDFPFKRTLEALAYSPRMVPGLITGLGIFYATIVFPPMGWLRDSLWILVVAYVMATLPLALGAIQPAVLQIGADLDRAARTVGASWFDSMRIVMLPLLKSSMVGSFMLLFIFHLKSYIIAIFLISPGLEVMGVTMLSLWTNGDVGVTAAFATLQMVLIALFLLATRLLFRVKLYD
ncbi:iron(III) transport system permease protein [Neorhizobium sp. 2083]|uniref:ABC transporter permease n=1 Tax=Neorhizobium sp. 2083 TaxID=2817762 RepID=UPI00285934F0|nr:iron ABC transporter permease [Neorhizobium sp. 2083]MDR6817545.1 iron(III) transport system permease protein [Neorhizobium sp. 2083]